MSRRAAGVALALAVVAVLAAAHRTWLPYLGAFLVVSDPLLASDAVLPLAGEHQRVAYAAELFERGLAERFLITPLPLASSVARERSVDHAARTAMSLGVPEEAVTVVPEAALSTYGEARNVRRLLEERGLRSLVVVTSPWHTRRARIAFREAFRGSDIAVSVQPLPDRAYAYWGHAYRPDEWWTYKLGRDPTVSEYLKLAAYLVGVR